MKRPRPPGFDAAYDQDAYVEVLIAATWEKQGAAAAARIVDRLDEPFLRSVGDNAGRGAVAEVERRLAALIAYCRDEVLPRVARLERGLAGIEAAGSDPAHAAWRATAVAFWPALRVALGRDHRAVWLKVHRLHRLLERLDPAERAAVEARHGPLLEPSGRAHAALRALWPGDRLRAVDARANALGLTIPDPAPPSRRLTGALPWPVARLTRVTARPNDDRRATTQLEEPCPPSISRSTRPPSATPSTPCAAPSPASRPCRSSRRSGSRRAAAR